MRWIDYRPISLLAILRSRGTGTCRRVSETFFETKIRPVLATDCLPCHGGKKTESGLKVDSRESLLQGGDRGPAIVAGKPEQSLLVRAIRQTDDELKMPPKRRLPAEVATAFAQWIAQGADWPKPKVTEAGGAGARSSPPLGVSADQGRCAAARPDRPVQPADRSVHRGQTREPPGCAPCGRPTGER